MFHDLISCLNTGLSESSLLYYNNVLSLPIMGSYMLIATDELQTVQQYPKLHNPWFLVRTLLHMILQRQKEVAVLPAAAAMLCLC